MNTRKVVIKFMGILAIIALLVTALAPIVFLISSQFAVPGIEVNIDEDEGVTAPVSLEVPAVPGSNVVEMIVEEGGGSPVESADENIE